LTYWVAVKFLKGGGCGVGVVVVTEVVVFVGVVVVTVVCEVVVAEVDVVAEVEVVRDSSVPPLPVVVVVTSGWGGISIIRIASTMSVCCEAPPNL
jgi:hypothetical protein